MGFVLIIVKSNTYFPAPKSKIVILEQTYYVSYIPSYGHSREQNAFLACTPMA